ncbi:MAG: FAD-dependent oxidoreductase [Phycisphaerales bacterium]
MAGIGSVVIVGGGLAGITAALRLSERGVRVTLLETRTKLGGRATSFTDVRTGEVIDTASTSPWAAARTTLICAAGSA